MELLKANDNFSQYICGFINNKDFILEFGLIIDEITSVTVFEKEIDVSLVLSSFVKFDDVGGIHGFHALDFSI
jgi:hypothetical protein